MADQSKRTFSICIPNYNYGQFIGDTIESVLFEFGDEKTLQSLGITR
jgi:hypothetical protein